MPGITDGEENLKELGRLIGRWKNLKGLDVLAYHTMGVSKYKELGIPYPLEGIAKMEPEHAAQKRMWGKQRALLAAAFCQADAQI